MKHLHQSSDNRGSGIVNPTMHSKVEKLPKDVRKGARLFVDGVMHKMPRRPKPDDDAEFDGCTDKLIYRVPQLRSGGEKPKEKKGYMVKPYYEFMDGWDWVHYPLAGWAEMTTQGLYHAGGIGHLTQKVSTVLDHRAENKPLLVVELGSNQLKTIGEIARNQDLDSDPYGRDIFDDNEPLDEIHPVTNIRDEALKIGIMDFLTNHQDRHQYNMMAEWDNGDRDGFIGRVLSIDNGRAFGYHLPNRFAEAGRAGKDFLWHYLHGPAHRALLRIPNDEEEYDARDIKGAFEWWRKNSPQIRREFKRHLKAIIDPNVSQWLHKNFELRANLLDKMARNHKRVMDNPYKSEWGVSLLDNKHGEDFAGPPESADW